MNDGKLNHGGDGGGGVSPAAVAAAAVAAMDNDWLQKHPETRALMVARRRAMTIVDGRQQRNNQPTMGAANVGRECGSNSNSNGRGDNGSSGGCEDNSGDSNGHDNDDDNNDVNNVDFDNDDVDDDDDNNNYHQKWFYAPYRIVEMYFHLI
jgi:hypothetical protein